MAKPKLTLDAMLARAEEIELPAGSRLSALDKHPLRAQIIGCFQRKVHPQRVYQILQEEGCPLTIERLRHYNREVQEGRIK